MKIRNSCISFAASTEAATFVLQMCIKFCMAPYRKFLLCNGSSLPWHIVANAIQCTLWTVNDVTVGASWISKKHPPFCMVNCNPYRVEQGATYVYLFLMTSVISLTVHGVQNVLCMRRQTFHTYDTSYELTVRNT